MEVNRKQGIRGITLLGAGLAWLGAAAAGAGVRLPAAELEPPPASGGAGVRLPAAELAPPPGSADGEPARSAGLVFAPPAGWVGEKPAGGMRLAQGTIPGPGGPAQFGVFFFGRGRGGSAADNVERWIAQIDGPTAPAARHAFSANGLRVTWVEAAGTLEPSQIGMGPATAQPGWRLLGAVVEGPGGPWFFKVVGPDATVAGAREAFLQMLRDARPR
jgi:hypothetical protein